jgi:hypothetical protein
MSWPGPTAIGRMSASMNKSNFIFQIFYDEPTKQALDPGFIPLDNTKNQRPDWFEFWVIKNFLESNLLVENSWYGFLSPSFFRKTGLKSDQIHNFVEHINDKGDVALITFAWDQIAYFQNPFEQGELWHPGITGLSQELLSQLNYDIDLKELVTHSLNFTFSNYIIAKAPYWKEWQAIAAKVFDLIENNRSEPAPDFRRLTSYGSKSNFAPIKAFIQERLPSIILDRNRFRTVAFNTSATFPIIERLFTDDPYSRALLQTCDFLKQRYCEERNPRFIDLYREIRSLIPVKF